MVDTLKTKWNDILHYIKEEHDILYGIRGCGDSI